ASFNPTMPEFGVFDEPIPISICSRSEPIGFEDRLPILLYELEIAARAPVIRVSDDVQRSRIRTRPGVTIVFEPPNQPGALRYLVRNLAVVALILLQEIQCRPCSRIVTV